MSLLSFFLRKKFWLKDFLNGSKMWNDFKEVHYIRAHVEEGELLRKRHLIDFLKFVHENTPFYKSLPYSERLQDYPIVDKNIIKSNYEKFQTPKYLIPEQKGELHIQKTSGSSGNPFVFPQNEKCRIRRIATIKEENEIIHFHSFEKMAHLRSLHHYYNDIKGKDIYINQKLNIIYIDNSNLTPDKIAKILDTFNKEKVKFVRGYMTSIDTITRYAVENNIHLKYHPTFISVGELLLESLRKRIVEELKCNVISQYANEENGILGHSKVNGKGTYIELNRANCYIEVLKFDSDEQVAPGELGRIVVTDFTNYAMPMIRYDIGDVATIGETHNGILLSLDNLSGRKTDMIFKTNGEKFDLFNSITPEIYDNPLIRQWQFIQKSQFEYTLKLAIQSESIKQNESLYIKELKELLGNDSLINIEYCDEIPVMSSGKRRIVICELNN